MKAIHFSLVIAALTFAGCAGNQEESKDTTSGDTSLKSNSTESGGASASSDEVVGHYLHLKNALTNDNSKEAAEAGKKLDDALTKLDKAALTADQKKVYDEVKADIKEHAEHISANAENIAHQREHFDMLSTGMYDLVKSAKPSQTLYKDHCPMFNDKKGAMWLSEVKEIKNPYYGKAMLTCGEQQEEIK